MLKRSRYCSGEAESNLLQNYASLLQRWYRNPNDYVIWQYSVSTCTILVGFVPSEKRRTWLLTNCAELWFKTANASNNMIYTTHYHCQYSYLDSQPRRKRRHGAWGINVGEGRWLGCRQGDKSERWWNYHRNYSAGWAQSDGNRTNNTSRISVIISRRRCAAAAAAARRWQHLCVHFTADSVKRCNQQWPVCHVTLHRLASLTDAVTDVADERRCWRWRHLTSFDIDSASALDQQSQPIGDVIEASHHCPTVMTISQNTSTPVCRYVSLT